MSVDYCLEASTTVPMVSEVEVIGLRKISNSPLLSTLFVEGKAWILSLWKDRTDQIKSMEIMHKMIGRNDGFVVQVKCTGPDSTTTFFAKVQHASMDTVLMHNLLKNMRCGPDRFYIALFKVRKNYIHGVITEEVRDWTMTSDLTFIKPNFLMNGKKHMTTATFLLTLLIELGRFGNIPNNRDNWGFVDSDSVPYPHMSMIDFSRGDRERRSFDDQRIFLLYWYECIDYLCRKWQPRCGPIEDLQLFRDRLADFHKSLAEHVLRIEDEIQHFPFLQSHGALLEVLQSACDETAVWLENTIDRAREADCQYPSNIIVEHTEPEILSAFHNIPKPMVRDVPVGYAVLLREYESLVKEWNRSVKLLLKWFPFPNKDAATEIGKDTASATGMPNNDTDIPATMHAAAL